MSSNICGNCANFKPRQGEKLFNCTLAQNAGVKYAMQVRADTRSCEAFSPLKKSPTVTAETKPSPPAKKRVQPSGVLCNWGRLILIAAIIIIILLLAWGAYSCFSGGGTPTTTPTPTPTPTAPPTPTGYMPTPTPTPTPIPVTYFDFGELVTSSPWQIVISTPQRVTTYNGPGPHVAPAGTVYIIVPVYVWNVGDTYLQVSAQNFKLVSAAGAVYGAVAPPLSINTTPPFPYYTKTVYPQGYMSGSILFNPPASAIELSVMIFVNGQFIAWNVP